MSKNKKPAFNVYVVSGEKPKTSWVRIGVAFGHIDNQGFNVLLDALPVNGRLVLREPMEDEPTDSEPKDD